MSPKDRDIMKQHRDVMATLIDSVKYRFRDDFNAVELVLPDPSPDDDLQTEFLNGLLGSNPNVTADIANRWIGAKKAGSVCTMAVAASVVTIGTGGASGDWCVLQLRDPIRVPVRAQVDIKLSQRVANQQIWVELVSGDFTIPNFVNGASNPNGGTPQQGAQWLLDTTVVTSAKTQTVNGGVAAQVTGRVIPTTANFGILEIETSPDEIYFSARTPDVETTGKVNTYLHSSKIPDAEQELYLQIRCVNTGAASNTNVQIDFANLLEIFEQMVEVTGGRGSSAAMSNSIPVFTSGSSGVDTGRSAVDGFVPNATQSSIALIEGFNGTTWDRLRSSGDNADALAVGTAGWLRMIAEQYGYSPSAGVGLWERLRNANKFIPLSAVAVGAEATIWTPAAGRKFRLMGFCLTAGVAGGAVTIKDNTGGTTILVLPTTTAGTPVVSPQMWNGILSAAANNVLTATGIATETLSGFLFGTEE